MKTGKFRKPEIWLRWLLVLAAIWHLTVAAPAAPVQIVAVEGPVNLGKSSWKFRLGDDPAWARPEVSDANWQVVDLANATENSPATRFTGFAWYRIEIKLPPNQGTEKPTPVGILCGSSIFDGQEIYANGVKLGQVGITAPDEIGKIPLLQAFPLPAQAIGPDGTVLLAIRYLQGANYVHVFAKGGGLQPQVRVGDLDVLQSMARKSMLEREVSKLDSMLFTSIFLLVGVYHLYLFSRRRQLKEYFWFGLVALAQSVNAGCSTFQFMNWIGIGPMHRVSPIAVHLELIFAFEFLWPFLSRKIGPVVRGVQLLQVVLLLVCLLAPFRVFYLPIWQWHFPLMVVPPLLMYLGLTMWKAWQGNPEARTIVTGVAGFVLMEVFEVGASIFNWPQWNAGQWGLLVFLISMAASLANRFARTYKELDTLNQELEQKVIDRTKELDGKNVELADNLKQLELAKSETEGKNQELDRKNLELDRKISELNRKNEELIASQQRADRIFSALAEALPGTVLEGKYQLEDKIGSGGFGAVFRATHLALGRKVAVKVFRPTPGNDSADAVERFRREGMSAARINHPNAMRVLDSGISDEGIAYLVMELLEGHSLWEELQNRGYLSLRRTAEILVPVCQALAEAHRLGIVHRDIKPANIFLHQTDEGEIVKVVDFGIAKLVGEAGSGAGYDLTATGGIVGTPTYMAPERLSGKAYDGKSDVYSLGVMLYEMLCGRPPFVAEENAYQVILAHLQEPPPPLHQFNPNLPESVEAVILEVLAKKPADRPGPLLLAEQFADAVRPHLGTPEEASSGKITGEYRFGKLTTTVRADTAEDTATAQVPLAEAPTVTIKQKEPLRSQDAPTETFQGIPSDQK